MVKYYVHPWLKENLNSLKNAVNNHDWDGLILVDGMEGSGKSTLAQQVARYLDPSFNLDRIVFTPHQFIKAVKEAEKGQCIIWDETDAQSSNVMSKNYQVLRRFLQVIRERNLFLILVAPYIFDLDKYVAVARSRFLLHVFTYGFKRGTYEFYNYNSKKKLYFMGKQRHWDYSVVKHDWPNPGKFSSGYVVDPTKYKEKKRNATNQISEGEYDIYAARDKWIVKAKEELELTNADIGKIFGLSGERIRQIISKSE